jgi:glycosyltransferase involved in cell wall biosynthesis
MANDPLYKELASQDPAKRAGDGLNALLNDATQSDDIAIVDEKLLAKEEARIEAERQAVEAAAAEEALAVDVKEARQEAPILEYTSDRAEVRLLWLTQDVTLMQNGSLSERRMLELSTLFPEIHVVVLNIRGREALLPLRLAENVWVYPTNSRYWWKLPFDGARVAEEQLAFAGGFRADVVIAEDSFESGLAGYLTTKKYERPLQVHILEDIYDPEFKNLEAHNGIRLFVSNYVLKRASCVRTQSVAVRDQILFEHKKLKDVIEELPVYHDLSAWRDYVPTFNLHDRYRQFKFIMLHISSMQAYSHTDRVIHGVARTLLQYPTVGLVIVGSGPMRTAIEKLVTSLGLQRQVVFEPLQGEVLSHMKTANVLVHLSDSREEDEIILQGATVKVPMILSNTGLAAELFSDGNSAFLCPSDDSSCVSNRVNTYLNENLARTSFALNAQEIVFERIEQDYQAYLRAYKNSIERCV